MAEISQGELERPAAGGGWPPEAAIDWRHLERQCLGDAALAQELLGLFAAQARQLSTQIGDAALAPPALADLAHRLKGSALAVGANALAARAGALETLCRNGAARASIAAAAAPVSAAAAAACAAVAERGMQLWAA